MEASFYGMNCFSAQGVAVADLFDPCHQALPSFSACSTHPRICETMIVRVLHAARLLPIGAEEKSVTGRYKLAFAMSPTDVAAI